MEVLVVMTRNYSRGFIQFFCPRVSTLLICDLAPIPRGAIAPSFCKSPPAVHFSHRDAPLHTFWGNTLHEVDVGFLWGRLLWVSAPLATEELGRLWARDKSRIICENATSNNAAGNALACKVFLKIYLIFFLTTEFTGVFFDKMIRRTPL